MFTSKLNKSDQLNRKKYVWEDQNPKKHMNIVILKRDKSYCLIIRSKIQISKQFLARNLRVRIEFRIKFIGTGITKAKNSLKILLFFAAS